MWEGSAGGVQAVFGTKHGASLSVERTNVFGFQMTQKVHVRIESHFWLPFRAPGEVQIELFINSPQATASKPFSVNPAANSSKRAIGQERDATNHPGAESFDGELARFLIFERPLTDEELRQTVDSLKKMYSIP